MPGASGVHEPSGEHLRALRYLPLPNSLQDGVWALVVGNKLYSLRE